jgi:cytidylate kinase
VGNLSGIINIAIDGPSGAGKSTIAKLIAAEYKILYLDTGAMYRAVGLKCLKLGIDSLNAARVEPVIRNMRIDIVYKDGAQTIISDGCDVTAEIRAHAVSKAASDASAIPSVRLKLVELQRAIASRQSAVLDGRDIGTYVLPDADYKFYLTADAKERAARRYKELCGQGQNIDYETVLADINRRDYNDMNRTFAPLRQADDAILVDSTGKTIEEVVSIIKTFLK